MTTFSAVVTTGIYCRPGCGANPRAENVRTFELAAAAEAQGFRACLRCRPYRVAGTFAWQAPELVCRAVRMVIAGALDEGTEEDLGTRLGLSARHLRRLFQEHLGLTPGQLARSKRAHFARRLLDDTDLTIADVAFASGFGSLRQFNRTMREIFRFSPQELRHRRRKADRLAADGGLALRLPVSTSYDWDAMRAFLSDWAIPGVEAVEAQTYRRTIMLDGGPGLLEIGPDGNGELLLCLHLPYWEGLIHVVERVRRMLGLDILPAVPGVWGAFEAGVHILVRQRCEPAEAKAVVAQLVTAYGTPIPGLAHGLTHAFPSAETVAGADLDTIGLPKVISGPIHRFATGVTTGRFDGDEAVIAAMAMADSAAAAQLARRLGGVA